MRHVAPIKKGTHHSKIIGAHGEIFVANWLSRSGFEVTIADHTGLDLIAYNPSTGYRLGITVKSRTRGAGKEAAHVNVFSNRKRSSDRDKLKAACNAFACDPWVAVYVETGHFADLYLLSLRRFDEAYRPNKSCAIDTWKMGEQQRRAYGLDKEVQHIRVDFTALNWTVTGLKA